MASPYDPTRVHDRAVIEELCASTVSDTLLAAADSTASLVVADDREYPLAELVDAAQRRAEGLVSAGFAPCDRLGIWLQGGTEFVVWVYAAMFAGGSAVFIPPRAPIAEAQRLSRAGNLRWVIGHTVGEGVVAAGDPAARQFAGRATLPKVAPTGEASCVTTSGSTGTPKLTALSHRSWAAQVIAAQSVSGGSAEESMLVVLPMCHAAFLPNVHANLIHGRRVVCLPDFDAREALRVAAEERTAYVSVAPTMLGLMLRRGDWPNPDLRLRRISYGSAPMPARWAAEISRQFRCPEVVHGYGLAEVGGWATIQNPKTAADYEGSVGAMVRGHDQLVVLRPDGSVVEPGVDGEVGIRGPGQMIGYVGMPDETAHTLRGGWVHTGDLGRMNAAGELWITGRIKDQINRGGLKVGAREVETVIEELAGVTGVAVVAVPDDVLGERPAAMVEAPDLQPEQIREHLAKALADYKVPSRIAVVNEIPRNFFGKPDKPVIRRCLEETGP
jgi:acyl-CoA synthetase (AMP-forming)/AMP-acid ligase II